MQVNVTNTNGIVKELQAQRNEALDKVAIANGRIAELNEALSKASARVAELEASQVKPEDANIV